MQAHALAARLAQFGDSGLTDAELLSLACGISTADAAKLLVGDAPSRRLSFLRWEALGLVSQRRARGTAVELPVLAEAGRVAELLRPELAMAAVEELHVLGLDARNRLLRRAVVARGGVNQVSVSAREVFRPLVAAGAARAIVAHNHPSGCSAPSTEDRMLTARLAVAGDLLGIPLVDHLVIARDGYYSFAEQRGAD